MWRIAGHEIVVTGGGRDDETYGYWLRIQCFECPNDPGDWGPFWSADDEIDPTVDYGAALRAVVEHVGPVAGIGIDTLDAASVMAALQDHLESGLDILYEQQGPVN